ncbi:hypothetical protein [Halomicrobium salinisoli]|uniref:hypothetical protein n=1 Tax=Halomicrobium salinisoli TaxID=2878391 RepID=UPI001CF07780|nr:hypothetical protein [Halomicrobium salinisoli]
MSDLYKRVMQWILLDGNRHAVAGLFAFASFIILSSLGLSGIIHLGDQAAVRGTVGGFIPGLIAFLSVVLAINQLVLSQEFGSAGEVRNRITQVREYRQDVEETADMGPSPVLPTGFLSFVIQTIEAKATALEESVGPETDPRVHEATLEYSKSVTAEARDARRSLEEVRPGRINALIPVLEYPDSRQLFQARRLQFDLEEDLPRDAQQALSDVIEAIELFSVARVQFRTTYTQRTLARLSRQLQYVGLPALLVAVVVGLLNPSYMFTLPDPIVAILISALFACILSPIATLAAFLLRIAVISERTIAVGPFVSRPKAAEMTDRSGSDEKLSRQSDITSKQENEEQ